MMYLQHSKEHENGNYFALFVENKLNDKLIIMDKQMNEQYDLLVKQLMESRRITKELKQKDQMK